jgi:hypothetical protein
VRALKYYTDASPQTFRWAQAHTALRDEFAIIDNTLQPVFSHLMGGTAFISHLASVWPVSRPQRPSPPTSAFDGTGPRSEHPHAPHPNLSIGAVITHCGAPPAATVWQANQLELFDKLESGDYPAAIKLQENALTPWCERHAHAHTLCPARPWSSCCALVAVWSCCALVTASRLACACALPPQDGLAVSPPVPLPSVAHQERFPRQGGHMDVGRGAACQGCSRHERPRRTHR